MKTEHALLINSGGFVRFRMSHKVWLLLGLDDDALVSQTFPSLRRVAWASPTVDVYEADLADARCILDDMRERSLDVVGGFEHTPSERRALRRAAEHLADVLTAHNLEK